MRIVRYLRNRPSGTCQTAQQPKCHAVVAKGFAVEAKRSAVKRNHAQKVRVPVV